MTETKSVIVNIRITPMEHKELEARFGTPGKALRYSVDTIMADRKVRMPDAQFLVFPNAMVEVDSIVTAQQLEGGFINPGQDYIPKVRVQLHSGTYVDVHATYDQFLTELAKARMAN